MDVIKQIERPPCHQACIHLTSIIIGQAITVLRVVDTKGPDFDAAVCREVLENVCVSWIGNNTLNVYGARLSGDIIGGLGYSAELDANSGRNNIAAGQPAYHGDEYSLGLKYGNQVISLPVRAKLEYARGSDDFAAIAPGRRYGIIWGEFTDVPGDPSTVNRGTNPNAPGLSNLNVLDAGVGVNPIPKLGIDFNAYRFQYDAHLGGVGTSAATEYDLILSWKHSDNVSFDINAADMQVGNALQTISGGKDSPVTELGADVKIKF